MAIDSSNCLLPSERAPSASAAASALGHLARLLARQVAREVVAAGLVAVPNSTRQDTLPTSPLPVVDPPPTNNSSIG